MTAHAGLVISMLGACGLLAACGQPSTGASDTAAPPAAPKPTPEQTAAALAALPAPYNTADLQNGERKFGMCRSCHTIVPGGPNLTGPNLHGVFGRKAGEVEGYKYSDAVKNAGFVWDGEHLDKWLAEPRTFLPGTKMSFAGLKNEKDRIDLIAFLKLETGYQPAR